MDDLAGRIILSATLDPKAELENIASSKADDFEKMPFVYQVLIKKLDVFEVKTKFTVLAAILISLYAKGNPGMVQMIAAKTIEKEQEIVTVSHVIEAFPEDAPNMEDKEIEKVWNSQKMKSGNLVDTPAFWHLLSEGMSMEQTIGELVAKAAEMK